MNDIQIVERVPSVEEYCSLRDAVGWPPVAAAAVREGLSRSIYLQDVIVRPEFQRQGIGTRITRDLLTHIGKNYVAGAFIGLMATRGALEFYERFGFKARAPDTPGMFMLLEGKSDVQQALEPDA